MKRWWLTSNDEVTISRWPRYLSVLVACLLAVVVLVATGTAEAHTRHHRSHHHARTHHRHHHHKRHAHAADVEETEEITWPEWEHDCVVEGLDPSWCHEIRVNSEEMEQIERAWTPQERADQEACTGEGIERNYGMWECQGTKAIPYAPEPDPAP